MDNDNREAAAARLSPGTPSPGRQDIITLLRTAQQHHVALSSMADQKANILIGVNSVVFALVVRDPAAMSLPMLMLAGTTALAALLCMLAVVPMTGGKKVADAVLNPNLLFFGAFTDLSEAEYQTRMHAMIADDDAMRTAMIRDIYQLGQVLRHKKYRWLGLGYRVFMVGLALSLAAMTAAFVVR